MAAAAAAPTPGAKVTVNPDPKSLPGQPGARSS